MAPESFGTYDYCAWAEDYRTVLPLTSLKKKRKIYCLIAVCYHGDSVVHVDTTCADIINENVLGMEADNRKAGVTLKIVIT